jgi:hypothetical protein
MPVSCSDTEETCASSVSLTKSKRERSVTALNAIPRLDSDYPGRNVVDAAVSNQDFPRAYRKPQENLFVDGMSVDLEDYFQVEAIASRIPRSAWPFIPSRIRSSTSRVLELLERNQCRATFFVLGWVAESLRSFEKLPKRGMNWHVIVTSTGRCIICLKASFGRICENRGR